MAEGAGTVPGAPLRVQSSSRLAFGLTTAALVTLASGGTAVLVSHGTSGLGTATSLPAGALPRDAGSAPAPLVVDGVAGSTPAPTPQPTVEQVLLEALSGRPVPGPRVLTVPLAPLGATPDVAMVDLPAVPPTPEPTVPPLPTPEPASGPPAVHRPHAAPPVTPPRGRAVGHAEHPDHPRHGKHAKHAKGAGHTEGAEQARHGRGGRHSR